MKGTIKFLNDWTQTLAGDLVQGNAAKTIEGFELPIRQATLKLRIEAAGLAIRRRFSLVNFGIDRHNRCSDAGRHCRKRRIAVARPDGRGLLLSTAIFAYLYAGTASVRITIPALPMSRLKFPMRTRGSLAMNPEGS